MISNFHNAFVDSVPIDLVPANPVSSISPRFIDPVSMVIVRDHEPVQFQTKSNQAKPQ
jgi:hypothetical protein